MIHFIIIFIFLILIFLLIICYQFYNNNNNEFKEVIHAECKYKRWGCCNDNLTVRLDPDGTNCRGF